MGVVYHDIEQNTPDWYKIRERTPLTGSVSFEFMSAQDLGWYARQLNKPSNFKGNYWTERGHDLEVVARDLLGRVMLKKGEISDLSDIKQTGFITNSKFEFAGGSPDGYTDDAIIEIKCFGKDNHLRQLASPDVKIISQTHWNCLISEKKKYILVFFCPDKTLSVDQQFKYETYDVIPQIHENMVKKIEEFGKIYRKIVDNS